MPLAEPAWDAWFELQYKLCQELDKLLDRELAGQVQFMRAAVTAALLEHLAERIRMHLDLPAATTDPPTVAAEDGCKHPFLEHGQWWYCLLLAGHEGNHRGSSRPISNAEMP